MTVADTLTMELVAANDCCGGTLEIENCLHTYFNVGDIGAVSLTGLQDTAFLDFAADANGERKARLNPPLRIPRETNRAYLDTSATVEIHDASLQRLIRVEKAGSNPRWSGTRGRPRNCRTTSTRRNTRTWCAWNPAMCGKTSWPSRPDKPRR